jgi:hypothetical protein
MMKNNQTKSLEGWAHRHVKMVNELPYLYQNPKQILKKDYNAK